MDVDWGAGNAVVGAASGKASVFSVESGRRVAALKGHSEEVTAVAWGKAAAPGMMISGCAGGEVRIWDMRAPAREVALLTGLR
jgi:WD40 repeat protein